MDFANHRFDLIFFNFKLLSIENKNLFTEVVNLARQLVDGFRADGAEKQFLTQITWYLIINVNPDGFEFTFNVSLNSLV